MVCELASVVKAEAKTSSILCSNIYLNYVWFHKFLSSFLGERTLDQRMQYLKKLDEEWDDGIEWADRAIFKLRAYNVEAEDERPWTAEWEQKWDRFLYQKRYNSKENRVKWTRSEWRFFVETCEHRSLVTGQCLEDNVLRAMMPTSTGSSTATITLFRTVSSLKVDLISQKDRHLSFRTWNLLMTPARWPMESVSWEEQSKRCSRCPEKGNENLIFDAALHVLHIFLTALQSTSWNADIDGMKTNPYPWKDKISPRWSLLLRINSKRNKKKGKR